MKYIKRLIFKLYNKLIGFDHSEHASTKLKELENILNDVKKTHTSSVYVNDNSRTSAQEFIEHVESSIECIKVAIKRLEEEDSLKYSGKMSELCNKLRQSSQCLSKYYNITD